MKNKAKKILSLFLSVAVLVSAIFALPAFAAEGDTATLSPVKMTYSHSHSTISGSNKGVFRALWNNYCAVYAITLESDIAFDVSAYDTSFSGRGGTAYLSSYENAGNLDFAHVYGTEASATHDTLATMLRENIYINGMSLGDAMESNTDFNYTSLLVGISGNKLTIMVPVGFYNATEDRTNANRNFNNATHGFYVGDYASTPAAVDYTITITEGIEIGGVAVNPINYQFTATNENNAKTGTFTEIIDTDNSATLEPAKMTYVHSHSTITGSHKGVFRTLWNNYCAVYAITLESDTIFDVSSYDTAFTGRSSTAYLSSYENAGNLDFAHVYGTEVSATHDTLATMLRENIYINGMSLGNAMESNTDFIYTSLLVGISGNKITIMVPVGFYNATEDRTNANRNFNNSTYGFYVGDYASTPAAVDYTISITEGIVIGDVAVSPMSYKFTATNESNAKTGTFSEVEIHTHTPAEAVRENEVPATCKAEGSYDEVVYCSVAGCGAEISRTAKTTDKLAHTPSTAVKENEVPNSCKAEGTYDEVVYCSVADCGAEISRTPKTTDKLAHTPGTAVKENEVQATCTEDGSYDEVVYCSVADCGAEISRTPKTTEKNGHTPGTAVRENVVGASCHSAGTYDEVVYCSVAGCGIEISRTSKSVDKLGHTPGTAVKENEVPASCKATGSYDEVVYCSVVGCGAEISRTAKTTDKLAHTSGTAVKENEVPATCMEKGTYDEVVYCSVDGCGAEISRTPKTTDKLAHTPGAAVKENEVPATCTAGGSYDEVVYCSVDGCGALISRRSKTTEKLPHTPSAAVKENEVPASCKAEGSYDEVVYCSVAGCGAEISRTPKTTDKLAHTPGAAVKENEVPATCTTEGSYDEVVYCTATGCAAELSRETKTIDLISHNTEEVKEIAATTEKEGTKAHYECTICEKLFSDAEGTTEVKAEELVISKLEKAEDNNDTTETNTKDEQKDEVKDDTSTDNNANVEDNTSTDNSEQSPVTGDKVAAVVLIVAIAGAALVFGRKIRKV